MSGRHRDRKDKEALFVFRSERSSSLLSVGLESILCLISPDFLISRPRPTRNDEVRISFEIVTGHLRRDSTVCYWFHDFVFLSTFQALTTLLDEPTVTK